MTERALPGWRLRGRGIALFERRVALVDPAFQLSLPQRMHALDAARTGHPVDQLDRVPTGVAPHADNLGVWEQPNTQPGEERCWSQRSRITSLADASQPPTTIVPGQL